jgi:hypothetical protein
VASTVLHEDSRFSQYHPLTNCLLPIIRIFEIAPGAKEIFRFGDDFEDGSEGMYEDTLFQAHAKSLFGMVDVLVRLLKSGKTSSLAGALVTLGGQHFGYGVRAAHYPIVGKALIYALETVLQEEFTKEAKSGWKQLYTVVSTGMVSTNIVVWVTRSDVVHSSHVSRILELGTIFLIPPSFLLKIQVEGAYYEEFNDE